MICQPQPCLGIRDTLIHNGKKAFEDEGTLAAKVKQDLSIEAELKRLRKENRQLKTERDILKKRRPSSPQRTVEARVH